MIVHVGLQDNEPGLDTRRLTLQEIGFFGAYCYRHQDFATALYLLTGGKVTGEGWTEIRPLDKKVVVMQESKTQMRPPAERAETSNASDGGSAKAATKKVTGA